jgi:hypothetical protein
MKLQIVGDDGAVLAEKDLPAAAVADPAAALDPVSLIALIELILDLISRFRNLFGPRS